jgi:hypothetical protein
MASGVLRCTSDVVVASDGAPICSGTWELVPMPIPFEVSQVDPVLFGQYLSFGFGLVLSLWVTARSIRALLNLIYQQIPRG